MTGSNGVLCMDDKGVSKEKRRKIMTIILSLAVILVPIALWDFNKVLKENETAREYRNLSDWAEQGTEALEYKLDGYFGILESVAVFLEEQKLSKDAAQRYIQKIWQKSGIIFYSLCISDKVENPDEMQKREIGISPDGYVKLAVPLYERDGSIRGSLSAEIQCTRLKLFEQYRDNEETPHVIVTDRTGRYILRDEETGFNKGNILEDFYKDKVSVECKKLQDRMNWNVKARFRISGENGGWIAVLNGSGDYGLCVFVLTEEENIAKNIDIYQKDVIYLSLKLFAVFLTIGGGYLYFYREEKRYIEKLTRHLILNEETYRITARHSNACIFTYDVESEKLQFLNEMYKEFGFEQELLSVPVLLKKIDNKKTQACVNIRILLDSIKEKKENAKEKVCVSLNGQDRYLMITITNIFDENGEISRSVGSIEDITNTEKTILKLQKDQQSLEKVAKKDMLTGAYSRTWGTHLIEEILGQNPEKGDVHVFIIADLDNFKKLNDDFGHLWGDKALYDVVKVMQSHCRSEDVVCRLGGDEFVIFLRDIPQEIVERKVKELSGRLVINYEKNQQNIQITASLGVSMAPECGTTFKELYECADRALYKVKKRDKNGYYIMWSQ